VDVILDAVDFKDETLLGRDDTNDVFIKLRLDVLGDLFLPMFRSEYDVDIEICESADGGISNPSPEGIALAWGVSPRLMCKT
jgi:hypothetical protein